MPFIERNPEKDLVPSSSKPWFNPKKIENIKRDVRDIARTGSRALEQGLGSAGNLAELALGVGNTATGGLIPTYETVQENLPVSLPTSKQLKDFSSKVTGGYTDPQTEGEQFFDDLVSSFTSLAVPGPLGAARALKNPKELISKGKLALNAAQAAGGTLARKALKNWGFGQGAQTAGDIITTLGIGIGGGKLALGNQMKRSFDESKKVAEGQIFPDRITNKLSQGLNKAEEYIKDRDFFGKDFVMERINSARKYMNPDINPFETSKVPVSDIVQKVKDLNSFFKDKKLTKTELDELQSVTKPFREALLEYGKGADPVAKEFGKHYAVANDIWQGFNNTSRIGDFFKRKVTLDLLKNPVTLGILGTSAWFQGIPGFVGSLATGVLAKETVKLADFMAHSSVGAKAFRGIMNGALNNSAGQVNRNLKLFDKAVTDYGYLPEGGRFISRGSKPAK